MAGCSYATPVKGPDGQGNWWDVHCSHDKSGCYQVAAQKCPLGYEVADQSERHGSVSFANTSGTMQATSNGNNAYGSYNGTTTTATAPTFHGEMLVRCKAPGAAPPPPPSAPPKCAEAFANRKVLADTFLSFNPGRQPVADLPSREALYKVCADASEAAQTCLWLESSGTRGQDCEQIYPTRDWLLIERLFLMPAN